MKTIYCDGSYHNKIQMMAIGIIGDTFEKYMEFPNFKNIAIQIKRVTIY